MTNTHIKATAYHEAGHAAAQLVFRQSPSRVTIHKRGTTLGAASHLDGDLFTDHGVRELVINIYAGNEAEKRAGGPCDGSQQDDEEAAKLLSQIDVPEAEMRQETARFILEHWALIERIATEMLRHTTLEWGEIDSLLNIFRGDATEHDLEEYRASMAFSMRA